MQPLWDARFTGDTAWEIRIARCDGHAWVDLSHAGASATIARAFLPYLQARLDAGTTSWGAAVDADHDGAITLAELLANSTFQSLLLPDVDVDGDGTPESMSFGFAIHAVAE